QDVLQKFATIINVQLTMQEGQKFPFIPFNGFESAKKSSKVFLYGPSGCGKSKAIFEIIRERIARIKRIYIINPRQTLGGESGRMSLFNLLSKAGHEDAVVWDNFPDDLVKRDVKSATGVLELVSSRDLNDLLIALKPRYMEIYREITRDDAVPEFHNVEISYDKDRFKKIMQEYGAQLSQFNRVYQGHVASRIEGVSQALWKKEPIPIAILDYYRELAGKEEGAGKKSINAVAEAEKLLRAGDYYESQFDFVTHAKERREDAEFLYTLKLCYEAGLGRTFGLIEKLQKGIFGSLPPRDPLRRLSTWVYLSGQDYAMHDARKDAIKFSDHVMLQIINYLIDNFQDVLPTENNQIYSFGMFLGKHVQFVPRDASQPFLPASVY
ncbi:MAG TPA: hypothetical protein VFT58_01725, partial [Nitrososphaera sp.]|nr:hypothetical protein [Nitrososphaera sp.]